MDVTVALVTCGPQLEVALAVSESPAASLVRLAGRSARSRLVLAAVDLLLEDAELEPGAISRVVVGRGPGSFTGIRSGLATAAGLAAATGARIVAYDSLLAQAARCRIPGTVWAAQPGRRGEVYARGFSITGDAPPEASGDIEILAVASAAGRSPWVAAETLDLGTAHRAPTNRSAAEALVELDRAGVASQPAEPLYFEEPPIDVGGRRG